MIFEVDNLMISYYLKKKIATVVAQTYNTNMVITKDYWLLASILIIDLCPSALEIIIIIIMAWYFIFLMHLNFNSFLHYFITAISGIPTIQSYYFYPRRSN